MNLRSIDLNLLTVFDAIFAARSLTAAAAKLAMSQPAVSSALSRLRALADDPLFVRTSQGMLPTTRAMELADPIRQALDLIQSGLRSPSAFDYAKSARRFVLAVGDYGEAVIMPRFVDWLAQAAPGVQIEIRPEGGRRLLDELRTGEVDIATDYFRIRAKEFKNTLLMEESLVSMVRQDHPTVGARLSLEEYAALPHVVLTQSRSIVDVELKKQGLTRTVSLRVPHFLSMPLIVNKTNFICTLPTRMATVYAGVFRTKLLKTPLELPSIPIYLMWHRSLDADPGHTWIRHSLEQLCQRL